MVMKVKEKKDIYTEGQRETQSAINATYSLKSNKCQLNSRPVVSMETLLRVEHRHFGLQIHNIYLIMRKHETVRHNTIIILTVFRIQ